jgi:hypothetical protein
MEGGDFMKIKDFANAVMYGVATCLGFEIVKKGIEVSRDPYKKAEFKKGFKKIKDAIIKKNES